MLLIAMLLQRATPLPTIDLTGKPVVTISEPLVWPAGFVELGNHRAVVIDGKDSRVALADFERNRLVTLGRHGAGPLEYRHPLGAYAAADGGAVIPDPANGRMLTIDGAGVITGSGFSRQEMSAVGGQLRGMDRSGVVYLYGSTASSETSSPILAWHPPARHVDTIAWTPQVKVEMGPPVHAPNGVITRSLRTAMFPFRTEWLVLASGGVAIVHPDPYRVEIIDARGNRHLGPVVARPLVPIDAAEHAALEQDRGGRMDGLPPAYPPFAGTEDAFAAPDGQVWVERSRRLRDSTAVYDVFDGTGKLTAQATLRPNSHLVGIGREMIYIVRQTTDDDFWYLEEWRRPR